jgi:hypothetical protein
MVMYILFVMSSFHFHLLFYVSHNESFCSVILRCF